jgi:hypothetical protein
MMRTAAAVTSALVFGAIFSAAAQRGTEQPGQPSQPPVPKADTPVTNPQVNSSAATLKAFTDRIDQYVAVRKKAAATAEPLKKTDDPAKIKSAEESLTSAIRAARPDAKPGDIFTPDAQALIRHLLSPELKGGEGDHARKVLKDDAPSPAAVPFKVNAKYPEGKPLPTVPPNLLLNLPKLPPEVEYRIVGKHLILRDTGADLIVDYMLNAVP